MRGPQDKYAREVEHICWGECFAKSLVQNGVDKNNIYLTGSIRNDGMVLNKNNENKEDILICTSFSNTFVTPKYIDIVLDQHDMDRKKYLKKIEITKQMRDAYFKDINQFAGKNPKKTIILRPHPYVELKDYEECYLSVNNLKKLPTNILIKREGSVHEAISKASTVICWQSGVLLDSSIMQKKVYLLEPFDIPDFMKVQFSKNFTKIKSLTEIYDNNLNQDDINSYIEYIYGKVDGKSSDRVASLICHLIYNNFNGFKNINLKKFFTLLLSSYKDLVIILLKKINLLSSLFPLYNGVSEDEKFLINLKKHSKTRVDNLKYKQTKFGKIILK